MSIVLTVGTFDTPHSGHLELFKKCRKLADLETPTSLYKRWYEGISIDRSNNQVIVGVNSDEFVYRFKGRTPAYPFLERFKIIQAIKEVDRVMENPGEDLQPLIYVVKPDFLVVGSDWAKKDYYKQTNLTDEWLNENNVMLLYVPYTEGISSTELRGRISGS